MYLFMAICIHISVFAIGAFKMSVSCHFVVKFWLNGSFRIRIGVKTSLVTDTENKIVLTVP